MRFIALLVCLLLGENALLTELSRQNVLSSNTSAKRMLTSTPGRLPHTSAAASNTNRNGATAPAFAVHGRETPPMLREAELTPTILFVSSGNAARPDAAALGESVIMRVQGLEQILDRAEKEHSPLTLFIDGLPVKGVTPSAIVHEKDEIAFTLVPSGPARAVWDKYLGIRGRDHFFTQDVTLTVGLENGRFTAEVPTDVPNVSLVLIRRPIFYFCAVLALLLFVLFHVVAHQSDLLRDQGLQPPSGRKPYSLSRVQMALWFFIAIVSFLLLWVETGRIDTMPVSVVILLGISAATALSAAVIDRTAPASLVPAESKGFFFDIVSDEHGVCFHRFQMAGWTLVLAVVFLYTVFTELRMPDFDTSILLLMGISSGTYLGYKIPERFTLAAA